MNLKTLFGLGLSLSMLTLVGCHHHHHHHDYDDRDRREDIHHDSDDHRDSGDHHDNDHHADDRSDHDAPHMDIVIEDSSAVAEVAPSKAATTQPSNSAVHGTVKFMPMDGKIHVTAEISGLEPNSVHGFHIHEKGDLSAPDLMSTGGHFNPAHHVHGAPNSGEVHAGDLGNLTADASGNARLDLMVSGLSIGTGAADDILGKAVIIHGKPDDLKSQPAGNAGPRVAGGLIVKQ